MATTSESIIRFLLFGAAFALVGCSSPEGTAQPLPESPTQPSARPEGAEVRTIVELTHGHLSFEVPESWEVHIEDWTEVVAEELSAEFNDHPVLEAVITNPEQTVMLDVFNNFPLSEMMALDADEVEVLHAEPIDIGGPSDDGDDIWLRAVVGENPVLNETRETSGAFDVRFEDKQYILVVAPYLAKADLGDPEDVGGGLSGFESPFSESSAAAGQQELITLAAGTINQTAAEELTGLEGLEAMQALVDTQEYQQLLEVIGTFEVHVRK